MALVSVLSEGWVGVGHRLLWSGPCGLGRHVVFVVLQIGGYCSVGGRRIGYWHIELLGMQEGLGLGEDSWRCGYVGAGLNGACGTAYPLAGRWV